MIGPEEYSPDLQEAERSENSNTRLESGSRSDEREQKESGRSVELTDDLGSRMGRTSAKEDESFGNRNEKEELAGFYKIANEVLERTFAIASLAPELVDEAAKIAVDIALRVTALGLSYFVKKDMETHHPEEVPVNENPSFRPYTQVIEEGIRNFEQKHPEWPVRWVRNDSYMKVSQYLRELTASGIDGTPASYILRKMQSGVPGQEIQGAILDFLPAEVVKTITRSEGNTTDLSVTYDDEVRSVNNFHVRQQIDKAYEEQEVKAPLSVSKVVEIMLEEQSGNLTAALYSTAAFLKTASRISNFVGDGKKETNEWFKTRIADEYSSLVPYQNLSDKMIAYPGEAHKTFGKAAIRVVGDAGNTPVLYNDDRPLYYDFSLSNQIGKPYHAANIVALLEYFPPEAIVGMVAGEYVRYGAQHGANKALADVMVLLELRNVEKVLKRYEQPESLKSNKG